MRQDVKNRLEAFLADEPAVRFAYLFGSRARGTEGHRSDYDIAVSLARGVPDPFDFRLKLLERLHRLLGTEQVDLVVLEAAPVLLRHRIIRDGIVLKDDRAARIAFETAALTQYLDTAHLRESHYQVARRSFVREPRGGR